MTFPAQHRTKLHFTNPFEHVNGEVKSRTDVVGIFPDEDAIICLASATLLPSSNRTMNGPFTEFDT